VGCKRRFCGNEVTPTELRNPHPRPFYRQVIPTGFAAEVFVPRDLSRRA
jgi:hypothetical protein